MKLSKKDEARQRMIARTLASGKALGGLLIGLTATAFTGCRNETGSADTMGRYPASMEQENRGSEKDHTLVTTAGVIGTLEPEMEQVKTGGTSVGTPGKPPAKTRNGVNENSVDGKAPTVMGKIAPPSAGRESQITPPGFYTVKPGETLTGIARKYGVTVKELQQLNGFNDQRANARKSGERIRVPAVVTNAVRETVSSGGKQPLKGAMLR